MKNNNYNKWSKNFHERPHRRWDFSLAKFIVTLDCFFSQPVGTVVHSMQRNTDVISWKVPLPVGDLNPI